MDEDLQPYQQRRDAAFAKEAETLIRKRRMQEYEVERQGYIDEMEAAGPMQFTKQFLDSVVVGGVQDALTSTNKKLAESAGWAMERVWRPQAELMGALGVAPDGYKPVGKPGSTEDMAARSKAMGDMAQAGIDKTVDTLDVMSKVEPRPTMNEPGSGTAATTEGMARSMVSFFTLYGPALKMFGRSGAGRLEGDIYAGAVADMLAFENKEGTFSDVARQYGFDNEVTQFLSGKLSDNEFDASMKAALEGAGMGAAFWMLGKTFRALRDGYNAGNLEGGMVTSGSPRSQRGAVGDLTPKPAEEKYLTELFGDETAKAELLDAAPSARMENGKFMVDPEDIEGLKGWMDDTVAAGGTIPPGFRNDDFLKRLETEDRKPIGTHASVEGIKELDSTRPLYVAQEGAGGDYAARPVTQQVFAKDGAKTVDGVIDEDLREVYFADNPEIAINKLKKQYPDADILVGDNGTTLVLNPNMVDMGDAVSPAARGASIAPSGKEVSLDERIDSFLTDDEKALMTKGDRTTMESLLKTSATASEIASMAAAGGAKRGWYEESTKALRHVFGDDADRFASLLSATSPQTSVESNLRNALNVWKNWDAAGRPKDMDEIVRIMGESVEGDKGKDSVLGAWINNSARALASNDPLAGLSGPKVDSFMRNLSGNLKEVTNDTWMARALGMSQSKDFSGRNLKDFADEMGSLGQKKAGYLAANLLTREAADIMKRATGVDWQPAEIQETVWSWAKAIYEAKGAKGETRTIPQILQSGEITDDIVKSTPDFATLFGQKGEFRELLETAGYGQQITTLPASRFGEGRAVSLDAAGQRDLSASARRLDRTSRTAGAGTKEDLSQLYQRTIARPVAGSIPGDVPGSFGRRVRRTGTGYLSDTPVTQYNLPTAKQAEFQKLGVATPPLNEFDAPVKFHQAALQAQSSHPRGGSMHVYSPEEYAQMRTFTTSDGTAGFAIKPDGDIVSVFNNRTGPHRGVSEHMVALAIEQGGKKLDAYDGPLVQIYDTMGMKEVKRDPWAEEYRPEGWKDEWGTPDVVYMELQ